MALLGRDQILQAADLQYEDVEVPEWGGTVRVKMMNGTERDAFEASTIRREGKKVQVNMVNMRARLVALALVDETGNRLFTEQDVTALGEKSASALVRVFEVAQRLNGLSADASQEVAIDFQPGPNGDSISG